MEVRLVVAHPSIETKQIRLGPETLIGRGHECKLRISSGQVSRRHCVIKVADTGVSVRDLGSANGTRLNGEAIAAETDVPVMAGSTVAVGPLKFVVQFAAPRTAADEDTERLPPLAAAAKSPAQDDQANATVLMAGGEETKDHPPMRNSGAAPRQAIAGREELQIAAGPSTASDAEAQADAGRATEHDISVDPAETIFDVSLEDRISSISGAGRPGRRTDAERASETDLLFEEDDLQRLMAEVDSAKTGARSTGSQSSGPDSETADEASDADARSAGQKGGGLLGFLKRKKKPAKTRPAPPPDDNDPLSKFLGDA